MTASSTTGPKLGTAGRFVDRTVSDLQRRLLSDSYRDPSAVAALARLRRGAGKRPGEVLDVLEFTVSEDFFVGRATAATHQENAAHLAVTLYALHQQSRGERMHRRGVDLGSALRLLNSGSPPDPILRRFRTLGTTDSFDELSHHLRGVVQLLRTGSRQLDYGLLADQLVGWQDGRRSQVQLAWARGFYRTTRGERTTGTDDTTDSPTS